jgi:outer membrane protein insertion porin family
MITRTLAVFGLAGLVAVAAGDARAFAQDQAPAAPQNQEAPPAAPPAAVPVPAPQAPDAQAPAAPQPSPPAQAAPGQPPRRLPPAGSAPLVRIIEVRFPTQGNQSVIDPQTYLYYIQTPASRPSDGVWVPYKEETVLEDFKRLWATKFLDNLWIEVNDMPYDNGVVGKHIIYNMEERQRVKIVDYSGSKALEQSKIDEVLKEQNIQVRLDSFIDPEIIRKVEGIVRQGLGEKGFQYAEVTHEIKPMPGGPNLVHLTFVMKEGPKVKIRSVDFAGNKAVGDGTLKRQMKNNKDGGGWLGWLGRSGTYQESKFEEDADKIQEYYRNRGYIGARVGVPELKHLEDSKDGKNRYIELKIPITEGNRYRVGSFTFDGNKVIKAEGLRPMFKIEEGAFYNEKFIRKGMEQAREAYGSGGYWEFTGYPDLRPRDQVPGNAPPEETPKGPEKAPDGSPFVDVVMRMQEGEQYFVNRVTFVGNTTTRDNVIRREVRLLEGGVFNTEAMKYSLKRINQLGYFKQIEASADNPKVEKTPGEKNKVDVTLKFEEQNRNQISFGAGVSQYEGVFGQLSYQTSNFLGRGESATFAVLAGSRTKNYQLAFSEPFLFDRPITAGLDLFKREIEYYYAYTQQMAGGNLVFGFPVKDFTRSYLTYSLEQVRVKDVNPLYLDPAVIGRNPFLADALLLSADGKSTGKRIISQITPSLVHNSIDNPIFPTQGTRITATTDLAGIGGNVNFIKPMFEGVWMRRINNRMSWGFRAQGAFIKPYGSTKTLPIYENLYLGGEYSIRGYDLRSVGPRDTETGIVIGGDKSLLFNAEYVINIAGPVRLVFYYDAGQVRDRGEKFAWDQFKTSTGAEIRFFMPVLNVPFRLIMAANPQRDGVYDNNLQPAKGFTFKFAVGTMF